MRTKSLVYDAVQGVYRKRYCVDTQLRNGAVRRFAVHYKVDDVTVDFMLARNVVLAQFVCKFLRQYPLRFVRLRLL